MEKIDLSTKKIEKQVKRTLNSILNSKADNEHYRFHYLNVKTTFNIDYNVFKNIKSLVKMIMSKEIINVNLTENFISETLLNLLENTYQDCDFATSKIKSKELINILENDINSIFEKEYDTFECYVHIDNLKLNRNIEVGNILFFTVSEYDKNLEKIDKKFFRKGETYALAVIRGLESKVFEKSKCDIQLAINIIKLFLPVAFCNFNIDGYTINAVEMPYILYSNSIKIIGNKITGPIMENINPIEKIEANKWGFDVVSNLIKSKYKTEFDERILTSVYWISEAKTKLNNISNKTSEGDDYENSINNLEFYDIHPVLLDITIALETLLIYDREPIDKCIASKVTNLITKPKYREYIEEFIIDTYDKRSKIVHTGNTYISKPSLEMLMNLSLSVIFKLIEYNHIYHNEIQFYNKKSN